MKTVKFNILIILSILLSLRFLKLLIQAHTNKPQNILIEQSHNDIANFNFLLLWMWLHNFKLLFFESLNHLNKYRNKTRKQRKLLIININIWWNSIFYMIWDIFDCWAALNDTCDENSELEKIKLQSEHWQRLEDIHILLYSF